MRTLALDISLKTGWACGAEGNLTFGTRDFSGLSGDYAVVGRRFAAWLNELLTKFEPGDLVIERPFLRNEGVSYLLGGMAWEAHRAAEIRNIPRKDYAPVSIKKFITGNARAKKTEVMEAVRGRGYAIMDDHQADAVALLLLHEASA